MALQRGLTEINGNFKTEARLVAADVKENSLVFIDGVPYTVDASDAGSGVLLDNGSFANPVGDGGVSNRFPISGASTTPVGFDFFTIANATITMDDVTAFTGGERFSIVAAKGILGSTLTVDGTQSEVIEPANGDPTDTVFNLDKAGVSYEFIFNAITGNWEV